MVQTVNVTVDNVSPLITYSPPEAWHEGTVEDQFLPQYYDQTYTQAVEFGASATLSFNGTTVWIYGAKRPNHGPFNTTLDGTPYYDTGYSATNLFQRVLFPGQSLSDGTHTVTIIDSPAQSTAPYLDVDYIVYQVQVPDGYNQLKQEDTDKAFKWFPSPEWSNNPQNVSGYSDGTGHTTTSPDAYMLYTFEGAHVEIYGAVGPSSGNYTVQVDNGTPFLFNGTKVNLTPQTLLYQDNSLAPGTHTVNISNSPFTGQSLSIDFAIIYSSQPPGSPSALSGGTIGGIAVGACAGILLILFGVFFWWRRRHRHPGLISAEDPKSTADTGPVTFHTPSLPATVERQHLISNASLTTDPSLINPSSTLNPTPPQSNSSGSNADSRARLILHNPTPSFGNSGHELQEMFSGPEITVPNQNPGHASRPLPQPGRPNPPPTTLVLAPVIEGDLRAMRMQVEGRSQDFGPVSFLPDPEHDGNILPPDYNQAIQPFPSTR
ncbi:hypothetical protein BJ322DRAFT_1035047 [Thelephora terrestris]|uniref:Transmembrane protein n=1 Tax=Thelephora terrestris TaxID=56493 RepID=A0A9P6LE38_9AGAM|nr:hypothetical protein BJ322DRAFT_1035047 [Thelephora terrestris]